MDLYTFLLLGGVIILFIILEYLRDRKYWNRIDRLLNRLQSQNYQEFRYYEDQYKNELEQFQKQVARAEKEQEAEEEKDELLQTHGNKITPEVLEEDWSKQEIEEVKDQLE